MTLQVARLQSRAKLEPRETIENKTIVVTTVKSPPYAMFKYRVLLIAAVNLN